MVHLLRYFCETGKAGMVYRDYYGFIQAVDDTEILIGQPDPSGQIPRPWSFYAEYPSVILLGLPRRGKTIEFQYQCRQIENGFLLPLRDLAGLDDIEGAISDINKWREWMKSGRNGELFIDALDEGKFEARRIINYLVVWIKRLDENIRSRLRIHLSCRQAEWERADNDKWLELFTHKMAEPEKEKEIHRKSCIVIELLDLTKKEITEFCIGKSIDPNCFFRDLPKELYKLAARPMTLGFLVEEFSQSGGHFPADIQTLYERIIQRRLQEHNEIYQRAGVSEIGPKSKREIAEHYAVTCTLTNREVIAPFSTGSLIEVQAGVSGHGLIEELATFKTDIFQAFGYDRFRFNEPEVADYLCARKLDTLIRDSELSAQKAIALLFPSPRHEYPVPILYRIALWLAALNNDFRSHVLAKNPGTVINDYIGDITVADKVKTWKWLEEKYGDREWFDDREWHDNIGVLACEELIPALIHVIEDHAKYGFTIRSLAIELARQGKLTGVASALSDIVTNSVGRESPGMLSLAGRALVELEPSHAKDLEAWLSLPTDIDPNNELLTQALETLWPDHINLKKLIDSLRPQEKYFGPVTYRMFLSKLAKQLNAEQRTQVLSALATELETRSQDKATKYTSHLDKPLHVSDLFGDFLVPQLNDWSKQLDLVPLLETWISVFDKACLHGLIHEHDSAKTIADIIGNSCELRQALCLQHTLIVYRYGPEPFKPFRFWRAFKASLYPKNEDLPFWKASLEKWLDDCPDLIPVAWDALMIAWRGAEFPSGFVEWIEEILRKDDILHEFWEDDKQCSLDSDWAREGIRQSASRKYEKEKREKAITEANLNVAAISSGDFDRLHWLVFYKYGELKPENDIRKHRTEAIEKEFGKPVADAYLLGLHAYWSKVHLPSLSDYYISNSTPWKVIFVLQAVDAWWKTGDRKWSDIPCSLRKSAIQAVLSEHDNLPDWHEELVSEEKEYSRAIWNEALDLEARSSGSYVHLANLIPRNKDFEFCREIAAQYLRDHQSVRIEVAGPLAEVFLIEDPGDEILDLIETQGKGYLANGSDPTGLIFLAVVWRYRQERVWQWVEENYLNKYDTRAQGFLRWILAVENVHFGGFWDRWPAWSKAEVLLLMLGDFLNLELPNSLRGGVVTDEDRLRSLRDDCLRKLAESGTPEVEDGLIELIDRKDMSKHRTMLLDTLDHIRRTVPKQLWKPLSPEDLLDFIERGKRPVRDHLELFDLTLEMVYDIREHIQAGESNLKMLFWTDDGGKKPRHEESFQVVFFDQLQHHPLSRKIIGVRELEISGGNKPDVLVACRTSQGEKIKVYIEIKRQQHDDLLKSPKDQLADKYLIDPEARNGLYVVGWFGPDFYGPSHKMLQDACGTVPDCVEALESCLQRICDDIASRRHDIDAIKAVVVNLEL